MVAKINTAIETSLDSSIRRLPLIFFDEFNYIKHRATQEAFIANFISNFSHDALIILGSNYGAKHLGLPPAPFADAVVEEMTKDNWQRRATDRIHHHIQFGQFSKDQLICLLHQKFREAILFHFDEDLDISDNFNVVLNKKMLYVCSRLYSGSLRTLSRCIRSSIENMKPRLDQYITALRKKGAKQTKCHSFLVRGDVRYLFMQLQLLDANGIVLMEMVDGSFKIGRHIKSPCRSMIPDFENGDDMSVPESFTEIKAKDDAVILDKPRGLKSTVKVLKECVLYYLRYNSDATDRLNGKSNKEIASELKVQYEKTSFSAFNKQFREEYAKYGLVYADHKLQKKLQQ